jgi:hypothetical protein
MKGPQKEDVESIDGVMTAFYEIVSGPAGPRDWERERHLCAPGARLMPTRHQDDGSHSVEIFDNDGYIASRTQIFAGMSFFEKEIARREERFGNIAHVWSTYEARGEPDGEVIVRGINSVQLYHDGKRWWLLSALWDNERPGNPLPEKYQSGSAE